MGVGGGVSVVMAAHDNVSGRHWLCVLHCHDDHVHSHTHADGTGGGGGIGGGTGADRGVGQGEEGGVVYGTAICMPAGCVPMHPSLYK